MTGAGVYVVYAALLVVMRTFASVSEAALQPLLPDLVPKEQMGTVSGWFACPPACTRANTHVACVVLSLRPDFIMSCKLGEWV
jgi:hypothetical protein